MGTNIFSASLSGMNAAQFGLSTTEHNIANASTPGYNRQVVELSTLAAQSTGSGFLGQGVSVAGIKRIYDQFITTQVRQEQAQATYLSTYHSSLSQIDNMLADPLAGASPAMQQFFDAMNAVANSPESVPARQTLLNSAQFAASRFQAIEQRLSEISEGLNGQISNTVTTINSYAQQIAALNGNIKRATANESAGRLPNDLLDQRDQLVNLLNKEVRATVQVQSNGTLAVFIGNGQALVVDEEPMALGTVQSAADPSKLDVVYRYRGNVVPIPSSNLQGGNLGAFLAFRDQSLEPARNELGRVALGLAMSLNQQNQMGVDLNGAAGGALFTAATPRVSQGAHNQGAAGISAAAITDVGKLTTSDYQLRFDGATYSMLRLSDNAVTNFGGVPGTFAVDGFEITLSAGAVAGDTFLIRPTANGARDIAVAINDPARIAAATPVRANASLDNIGTGRIAAAVVSSGLPLNPNLQNPVTLTFNDPATSYSLTFSNASIAGDVVDPIDPLVTGPTSVVTLASTANLTVGDPIVGGGFPPGTTVGSITNGTTFVAQMPVGGATNPPAPASNQTLQIGSYAYTPGADISFNGWTTQISGAPAAGDTFTVTANTNATGDNSNALKLAALQTKNILANGSASFQGMYGQLVAQVGSKTNELSVTSQAQTNMLNATIAQQQSVSGVNLDEEAANLIRYQRAYQAAAKAMQIANTMFDTLLAIGA